MEIRWSAGMFWQIEVYGSESKFRPLLEAQRQPYVLVATSQQRLWVDLVLSCFLRRRFTQDDLRDQPDDWDAIEGLSSTRSHKPPPK